MPNQLCIRINNIVIVASSLKSYLYIYQSKVQNVIDNQVIHTMIAIFHALCVLCNMHDLETDLSFNLSQFI